MAQSSFSALWDLEASAVALLSSADFPPPGGDAVSPIDGEIDTRTSIVKVEQLFAPARGRRGCNVC